MLRLRAEMKVPGLAWLELQASPDGDGSRYDQRAVFFPRGLAGRLYLAGFLYELTEGQCESVRDAVALHKRLRARLAGSEPFWPLGLPRWDDEVVCLGLRHQNGSVIAVWDRGAAAAEIVLPGVAGAAIELVPAAADRETWTVSVGDAGLSIRTLPGFTARLFSVEP